LYDAVLTPQKPLSPFAWGVCTYGQDTYVHDNCYEQGDSRGTVMHEQCSEHRMILLRLAAEYHRDIFL